jgi:hypothetical protein
MITASLDLLSSLPLVFEKSSAAGSADVAFRDWELENIVALALLMVSRVDRLRESWFPRDHEDASNFDWSRAEQVAELYKQWLGMVEPIVSKLRAREPRFEKLSGMEELKARYRDVKLMCLDMDHLKDSIGFFNSGGGIPFDVAMEELRNKLQ